MATYRKVLLLVIVAACLSGCSTLRSGGAPQPAFDIDRDLEELNKQFSNASQISEFYKSPTTTARNQFVTARLVQYNLRYIQFIRALGADKQQMDAASDLLLLALNLAGTITGGEQAKTVLAAVAASVTGGKSIIDKDFFYEKTVPALVAAMNAQRKEVLVRIIEGSKFDLEQYSLTQAISDLHDYYFAGTLQGAVIGIQLSAGAKEQVADADIRRLSRSTVQDVLDRDRLQRTIASLSERRDDASITAVLGALGLDASGSVDEKIIRLQKAHRDANTPDLVKRVGAAFGAAKVPLLN